jgi:hypothetical protein
MCRKMNCCPKLQKFGGDSRSATTWRVACVDRGGVATVWHNSDAGGRVVTPPQYVHLLLAVEAVACIEVKRSDGSRGQEVAICRAVTAQ